MAKDRSKRALAAAKRLYQRKPDGTTEEFRKVCERADKATIGKLTNREFNASYVLPFRRSAALQGRVTGKHRATKSSPRSAKKGTRRRTTKGTQRGGRRKLTPERRIARLVRERDAELLQAANDPSKVYQIAAGVEEFAATILKVASR